MQALFDMGVLQYVKRISLPKDAHVLPSMFVYRIKCDEDGDPDKLKSRLCPLGNKQIAGLDYNETFASMGMPKALRVLLSIAAKYDLDLCHLDVPNAFVNADVDEDVYMRIPPPYDKGHEDEVFKIVKALYGLHQSGRNWWLLISKFLVQKLGFTACVSDPNMFTKVGKSGKKIYLFLFVDDMIGAYDRRTQQAEWDEIVAALVQEYRVTIKGEPKLLLGMRVQRDRKKRTIAIDLKQYVLDKLKKFQFDQCKPESTPEVALGAAGLADEYNNPGELVNKTKYQEMVGALMYAAVRGRPDISHAVHECARYMAEPHEKHLKRVHRVFRYLNGTADLGLVFGNRVSEHDDSKGKRASVTAYGDADWGNSRPNRKSTSGWIVTLNGDPISWSCKQQGVVAQSSCEAELYAACAATNEVLWLRDLLNELEVELSGTPQLKAELRSEGVLYCDNQSTIQVAKNGIKNSERTKHVDIKYNFITEKINAGLMKPMWIKSEDNIADIFTKSLCDRIFSKHRVKLLVQSDVD